MTRSRTLAFGGLAIVVIALAYVIFATGGGDAEYQLIFKEANGLVLGNQVMVGGVPVGSVKEIVLTNHQREAKVTIGVEDSIAPLHKGTTAEIRVPSLSSVANRYVDIKLGPDNYPALPDGASLPATFTKVATNLDELFNAFTPRTRRGLQELIEGFAAQYEGVGRQVSADSRYFSPALAATEHIFKELLREEKTLEAFLVEAAKAVGTIGAHSKELGALVRNGAAAFAAVGAHQRSLQRGLEELGPAFREGRKAFAELPSTAAALERLAAASKPTTKTLAPFFERLRTLLGGATPVVGELATAFSKPGSGNDLTDFALELPSLAKSLKTASPTGVKSLKESVPETALFGPYAPDLQGLFRDFGAGAGYYDADGHFLRSAPDFADFKQNGDKLTPVDPSESLEGLASGQSRRCPGAATQPAEDGSSPFADEGKLECEPSQVTP